MSDVEILEAQYVKYKNKNGKKAQNLKCRIESFKAMEKLIREHNMEKLTSKTK